MNLFVAAETNFDEFVQEINNILGLKLQKQKDEYDEWYAARTEEGLFEAWVHNFENDRDLRFEEYKYEITYWVNKSLAPEMIEEKQNEVGRRLFDKLKATKRYPLMLVYDVQSKLDEYKLPLSNISFFEDKTIANK
jgi:hypothetical protein